MTMIKTAISTSAAPAPAHTFHQGVRKGPFVQVSGQGPVDPHNRALPLPRRRHTTDDPNP